MSVPESSAARRRIRAAILLGLAAALAAACSGPILANPPAETITPALSTPRPSTLPDPQPIVFPRDDGPHDRLTEWWYYTGHLVADNGRRFGFEAVIFRAERGAAPVTWASHLALTDEWGGRFLYAQRAQIGPAVDQSPAAPDGSPVGFDLAITGFGPANPPNPADPASATRTPWVLAGAGGSDVIRAALSPDEAAAADGAFGLDLTLGTTRPPALHGGIGWIDFGLAGSSYYYSRTRMDVAGTLTLDGSGLRVTGNAWFDHQWGDFISVGGGGWDWFAVNLDDGTDLTISLVRATDGTYPLVYGTLIEADGTTRHLDRADLAVEPETDRTWTSALSGATYPAGWTLRVPDEGLIVRLRPTIADQELDTRATTGVVYWEGSQVVTATRNGVPLAGEGYVELTGYARATP